MRLLQDYRLAARAANRPLLALLLEALKLRFSVTHLGLSEYLEFQLYRDDLSDEEKRSFGGYRLQSVLEEILVEDYSRFISVDKVTMYAVLGGHGFSIPEVRAVYGAIRPDSRLRLRNVEDLDRFLRTPGNLPVYVKPAFGAFGRGNMLLTAIAGDEVVLGDGTSISVPELAGTLDKGKSLGWVFQQPLVSHRAIRELTQSDKISGLRIHTFFAPDRVEVIRAVFKINVGTRDSDNFAHGRSGNMLAAVDIETGKVQRVVSGTGISQQIDPPHPRSGRSLVGFEIPYWSQTLEMVKEAQAAFHGYICPGWDIAICDDGPRILEVNAFGDIDLSQHACRSGFIDSRFMSLMRERGLEDLLYSGPGRTRKSPHNHRLGVRKHHWAW